jgi:N-acetylmuramoyl-L-alanine amidase
MMRRAPRIALLVLAIGLMGVERPRGLGDVVRVRRWSYPEFTRVSVELSRDAEGAIEHLPPDPTARRPERLYLDLEGIWVGRRYEHGIPVDDGLLEAVRLGQNTLTKTRVVIDVANYGRHRMVFLSHPPRVVVDVYGEAITREARGTLAPRSPREGDARLPMGMRAVRTVVLDAGHGGRDPGALGFGLREKDITLRMARALAPELLRRGFRVVLTRNRDQYLSLEERTARAEAARGDLFVSIHANAAPRRSMQGIETYYLDADHERHSMRVAARENGVPRSQLDPLQRTLGRLRMSETSVHSRRLASDVQSALLRGMPRRFRPVQDLGVKKGPFYVLFLSDMPAILVETGFLTNRAEARRLADARYVEAIAGGIAEGIQRFRGRGQELAQVTPR